MKTSYILIFSIIILLFISSAATNFSLKKQFDRIDKTDPTYGFTKHDVASFSYVKLSGRGFGLTEIRQGDKPQIHTIVTDEENPLSWKVSNDTLYLTYKPRWNFIGFADLFGVPSTYIVTPQLTGVESDNIVSRIGKFKMDSLRIRQSGSKMLLYESVAKNIYAEVGQGGFLQLGNSNNFTQAQLTVSDSSTLEIGKTAFGDLKTKIDSTAQIKVPGNLIKSISM